MKIGDKVRLKTVSELESEFGPNWNDKIAVSVFSDMRKYLGQTLTVVSYTKEDSFDVYDFKETLYSFSGDVVVNNDIDNDLLAVLLT